MITNQLPPTSGGGFRNQGSKQRRRRSNRQSQNFMLVKARDSFSMGATSQVGDGSSIMIGDMSPLDSQYDTQTQSPTPKKSNGHDSRNGRTFAMNLQPTSVVSSFTTAATAPKDGNGSDCNKSAHANLCYNENVANNNETTNRASFLTQSNQNGKATILAAEKVTGKRGGGVIGDTKREQKSFSSQTRNLFTCKVSRVGAPHPVDEECSSDDGIPIPEELSVSQIPLDDHQNELLQNLSNHVDGGGAHRQEQKPSGNSSVLVSSTKRASFLKPSISSARKKSSFIEPPRLEKIKRTQPRTTPHLREINFNGHVDDFTSQSFSMVHHASKLGVENSKRCERNKQDDISAESSVILKQPLVLATDSHLNQMFAKTDCDHQDNASKINEKKGIKPYQQQRLFCRVPSQTEASMMLTTSEAAVFSPISTRSQNVRHKHIRKQMQQKVGLETKKKVVQDEAVQPQRPTQTQDEILSPHESPALQKVEEGVQAAKPATSRVLLPAFNETRVTQQLEELCEARGAHYNIFKRKPDLMALFDACKALEDDKASFATATATDVSTDESNEHIAASAAATASSPEIRPLDPSLANVRYLPPKGYDAPQFTLVLDLDETLIHYRDNSEQTEDEESEDQKAQASDKRLATEDDEEGAFFIRPGLSSFLQTMNKHYELILFTAATSEYADYFLKQIDHKNYFEGNVLTREHCQFEGDYAIKDLRLLGRDLRKTIIIDNLKENFEKTTPDNGIHIKNFEGCFDDTELPKFEKFLTNLALDDVDDVRDVIYDYRDKWETYPDHHLHNHCTE